MRSDVMRNAQQLQNTRSESSRFTFKTDDGRDCNFDNFFFINIRKKIVVYLVLSFPKRMSPKI